MQKPVSETTALQKPVAQCPKNALQKVFGGTIQKQKQLTFHTEPILEIRSSAKRFEFALT
jgi:hypothetical protein